MRRLSNLSLDAGRELPMVSCRLRAQDNVRLLTNCSDVSLSVFAYRIFGLLSETVEDPVVRSSGEDAGSERVDAPRTGSSGVGVWTEKDSFRVT